MGLRDVRILSTGRDLPATEITSEELERRLGLSSGWIERRTGVRARRIAAAHESTSDFAVGAARRALESGGVDAAELRLLVLATSTPDHLLPPTSTAIAHRLGARCAAFDLAGACCGFLLALPLAANQLREGERALVVAANTLSRRTHEGHVETATLFADGAGAVVLERAKGPGLRLVQHAAQSDGAQLETIWIPAGGSRQPLNHERLEAQEHTMRFDRGTLGFRRALELWVATARRVLEASGWGSTDIDHFLPHQANQRFLELLPKKLGLATGSLRSHLDRFGNTSAASIAILLDEALEENRLRPGDKLLLAAAGAGLNAAALTCEMDS